MTEPVFEAYGLTFGYGTQPVIRGLDIAMKAGRFYGIVGPNGSGKTTLLDLLIGLKRPASGTVKFWGRALPEYTKRELSRRVALAPQEFAVNFPYTVSELVFMGRHPHLARFAQPSEEDRRAVRRAMVEIDVLELKDKYVTDLSGGEKQRVMLARVLAQDTPVMVLDEPTSSLDIKHALHVLEVLDGLVQSGRTVVAVMHDLNLAAAYSDEMVFMSEGRVFASGATDAVLTPENVRSVFGVDSDVSYDPFWGARRVSFRRSARA